MILFLTLLLAVAAGAPAPDALQTLVASEKSFAQASVDHGIRSSFLQFFADDAVLFAPAPTNGKKFYANYDDKGRQLNWQPIFATISSAGDLGFTTGPWQMKKSATDEKPFAFGDFVSIWRKQADNSWKVVVDLGIDHPQPTEPPGEVNLLPPVEALRHTNVDLARRDLEKTEMSFTDALAKDAGAAIAALADNAIRVYREDAFPAAGRIPATVVLGADHGKTTRKQIGGDISASGDFAYRFGSYSTESGNVKGHGHFLTIWRYRASDREWKIIADVQKREEK
jgi:ketosteroid isomerase-like protein